MKGKTDRRIETVEYFAYCEPNKKPISFSSRAKATMAKKVGKRIDTAISQIFIPEGYKKVATELSEDIIVEFWKKNLKGWDKLFKHLTKH